MTVIALKLTERRTITDYFQGTFVELVWICAITIISSAVQMPLMQQMVPAFMFADVCLKYHFLPVAFYSIYQKYLVK